MVIRASDLHPFPPRIPHRGFERSLAELLAASPADLAAEWAKPGVDPEFLVAEAICMQEAVGEVHAWLIEHSA